MTDSVKLPSGWIATFDPNKAEALVEKNVRPTRRVLIQYNPPFMKRLHPTTRLPLLSAIYKLPRQADAKLRQEFEARWGTGQ